MISLVYSKLKRWLRVRTYFQQKHHAHIHLPPCTTPWKNSFLLLLLLPTFLGFFLFM